MGTLFIVATPIGNLEDITFRALKTLFEVNVIVTEDIVKTKNLLEKYRDQFATPLSFLRPRVAKSSSGGAKQESRFRIKSGMTENNPKQTFITINDFKEEQVVPRILDEFNQNKSVALVSEAGTPLISDPGFKLVREAIKLGAKVIPIPGPSAPIAALSASGLPSDKFLFLGFLPKKNGEKQKLFESLQDMFEVLENKHQPTIIFFESPHRLLETLQTLEAVLGDIEIVVARELTKLFEEIHTNTISYFLHIYENKNPKGEFTLLFSLKSQSST